MTTILIISPEAWDALFVSKHHYAKELALRGHDVVFYGPPSANKKIWLEDILMAKGRLRVLHAPLVARGLRKMPGAVRRFFEARWLHRLECLLQQQIDIVWNFENSRFFDFGFAGNRLKIYQQVDLDQDFEPDIAAATADLSIAISAPIEKRIASTARYLIRVTHGYSPVKGSDPIPDDLKGEFVKWNVNVVLTGNMDRAYLDIDLIAHLVEVHPDVRFHFVGSYTADKGLHAAIGSAANVIFWGRYPAAALPHFLRRADLLLVAYQADQYLEELANPHKIMEYLASGRCILSTLTLEYEGRSDLIEMPSNRDGYLQSFAAIVSNPSDWNTPDLVAHRQAFAFENTYSHQLNRIAQALGPRSILID